MNNVQIPEFLKYNRSRVSKTVMNYIMCSVILEEKLYQNDIELLVLKLSRSAIYDKTMSCGEIFPLMEQCWLYAKTIQELGKKTDEELQEYVNSNEFREMVETLEYVRPTEIFQDKFIELFPKEYFADNQDPVIVNKKNIRDCYIKHYREECMFNDRDRVPIHVITIEMKDGTTYEESYDSLRLSQYGLYSMTEVKEIAENRFRFLKQQLDEK